MIFVTPEGKRIIQIHTSDRVNWRGCRRRWDFVSPLRRNRTTWETPEALWQGSGFHFALEDYHGWNHFGHPGNAMEAFTEAWDKSPHHRLPDTWKVAMEMNIQMLAYYLEWLDVIPERKLLKTYWHNGEPQVEVTFRIVLPVPQWLLDMAGVDEVHYVGTFDRVVVDQFDFLRGMDYKTAIQFETRHLDTDSQVSAYSWAGSVVYDRPMEGLWYQQHLKDFVNEPRLLSTGKISTDKKQKVPSRYYKDELLNMYGSMGKVPDANIQCLNALVEKEDVHFDPFIRRDLGVRNEFQIAAEGEKILLELPEMLNPDAPLYPDPDRLKCSWCPVHDICVSMDDGSDWEDALEKTTIPRTEGRDSWRAYLPRP